MSQMPPLLGASTTCDPGESSTPRNLSFHGTRLCGFVLPLFHGSHCRLALLGSNSLRLILLLVLR